MNLVIGPCREQTGVPRYSAGRPFSSACVRPMRRRDGKRRIFVVAFCHRILYHKFGWKKLYRKDRGHLDHNEALHEMQILFAAWRAAAGAPDPVLPGF